MDAPTTNQSQAPWQPWAGQISLSTGPPQGPPCNPLHSFQNLSLGSTSDQSHSHDNRQRSRQPLTTQYHNQGYPGNHSTVASTNGTHYHTLYQASVVSHSSPSTAPQTKTTGQSTPLVLSNANQSLHISPMTPNANHRQNIPPSSLPLENQGPLPSTPQPMSPISHPFQPSHTHQGIVNGPQSLYHNDSPNTPPSAGQYVNQGPWSSPQPTCESANVGCSLPTPPPLAGGAGYNPSHLSPTPPIQQQPQWTLPPDCSGGMYLPVPDAASHPYKETSLQGETAMPASPNPESRYGLDPNPESRYGLDPNPESRYGLDPNPESRYGLDPNPESRYGLDPNPESRYGLDPNPESRYGLDPNPESRYGLDPNPESRYGLDPNPESRYGLDPKLLPSAVKVMEEDRAEWEGKVFVSEPNSALPPLATTDCIIEDRGNASPCAIRSTSYCMPCEGQSALLSHLPLGALVTPLARTATGEQPLPVCSESECVGGCGECGASMCPAMGWLDCGQRFYCPFCGKLCEVPWQHYQPTKGVEGVRVDKDKRPELSMGSYEISDSQKDEAAVLLLAIDVSASALRGGHLDLVTHQLHTLLTSLNGEDGAIQSDIRVGLMTYDSRIHLYDLSPALSRPHMLVVTETEDLQLPVREGLLVPLKDCIDSIESVLQLIPLFSPEGEDSTGVPVVLPVRAGLALLQAMNCPGKLLIFHTAPLIEGANTHCSSGFFGSNKPKSIFQPSEQPISLAEECVSQGCGVHLFILSQRDVGGAWPGHVPYLTGGALYSYSNLQGEMDRERFSCDLRRSVETETGYKAQLRIYVSKDLRVSGCYGSFVPGPNPSHVALATLDWRTTLAVELTHSRALDEKKAVVIQVVVSYSSQRGARRCRVHTLTLRCSRHLLDVFRNCQAQTLLAFYCKKMYCAVLERPLQELREELQTEVTEVLACYRKHCSSASVSTGQLVLPQYLRALPVYINSLRKSEVLLPGLRSSIHQRLQLRCQVLCMDTRGIATHFYPLLLPLPLSVNSSSKVSPPCLAEAVRCTAASLEPGGLYLVHGPLAQLLWVGSHVHTHTLVQLFNVNCFSSLPSGETKLLALDNPLSTCIRSLIDTLNSQAPYARKLWVVKQGDSCEEALQRQLVEDKSPNGGASYADFLYHLHVNSVRLLQ